MRQRARLKWKLDGDANTKFFHKVIQYRKLWNKIHCIAVGNIIYSEPNGIKKAVYNHFHNFFGASDNSLLCYLNSCFRVKA